MKKEKEESFRAMKKKLLFGFSFDVSTKLRIKVN